MIRVSFMTNRRYPIEKPSRERIFSEYQRNLEAGLSRLSTLQAFVSGNIPSSGEMQRCCFCHLY
jgi:hypothetical protein